MQSDANVIPTPLFQRYELMVELGRLEMVLDSAKSGGSAVQGDTLNALQSRCARIQEALSRLPA